MIVLVLQLCILAYYYQKKLTIKLRTSNGVRRHVYVFIKLCLQLHNVSLYVWNNMQREEMGIVNGNPMGMGINMVGEWEWLYANGSLKGIPAHLYCRVVTHHHSATCASYAKFLIRINAV